MTEILVAVPVLGRPQRAAPLAESLADAARLPYELLFLCSPGDTAEIAACRRTGALVDVVPWPAGRADWARKQNRAVRIALERGIPYLFTGADDLCFCPGWDDLAVRLSRRLGARGYVVGTNDLGNPRVRSGAHSTHSLVAVEYPARFGTIDEPDSGKLFHEGYDHNFCDDECVQTAQHRRAFVACRASEVPHLHPHWGKGSDDATYRKGQARFAADQQLYASRSHLWGRASRGRRGGRVRA